MAASAIRGRRSSGFACRSSLRTQCGDEGAGDAAPMALTGVHQGHQCTLDRPQRIEPLAHGHELVGSQLPGLRALGAIVELKKHSDLIQREPELLRGLDELKSLHMVWAVSPHLSRRTCRLGQQAASLVVAKGFDADTGGLGDTADRQG